MNTYSLEALSDEFDLNALQNLTLRIRSDFVTWAARQQMFQTVALFSSVSVVVSSRIEGLSDLRVSQQRVHLLLSQKLVEAYDSGPEVVFFVIMHKLRFLISAAFQHRWRHLVDFVPLVKALEEVVPRSVMLRAGLAGVLDDFELKEEIFGMASDAAIFEELKELFGAQVLGAVTKAAGIAPVTVEMLERITSDRLEPKQDWLYYAKHLVASLAGRIGREPDLARLLVDRQVLRQVRDGGFSTATVKAEHFSDLDMLLGRVDGETKKMADSFASQIGAGPGTEAGEDEEMYLARTELNEGIKQMLDIVRRALAVGSRVKSKERKTYAKPHAFLAEAPGLRRLYESRAHPETVIVLDTSGSMWIPEVLEQMAGLSYQLKKRDLIQKAYCCDVELHPLEVSRAGRVRFRGFGGTEWTKEHHSQILRDLDTSEKLTVYYFTDGEVNGLAGALEDERVKLTVVNVPQIIDGSRYVKAKL